MKGSTLCPCGCGLDVTVQVKWILESLEREMRLVHDYSYELIINSGARCENYNKTVSDSSPNSGHTKGMAVDLHCKNNHFKWLMKRHLYKCNVKRIGDGVAKGQFVHFDLCIGKVPYQHDGIIDYPQETEWSY